MDYNKLKSFLLIAEHGSVTKAAHLLRRTQPAVTLQVKGLEEELGFALFDRKGSKIMLTSQGQRLFQIGQTMLGSIDEEISKIKKDGSIIEGTIRIAVLSDQGWDYPLGEYIGSFIEKYPNVTFSTVYEPSENIEGRILANESDFGLLVNFKQRELFERIPIMKSEHVLVSSPAYLRMHPISSYADILEAKLIDFTEDFLCIGAWLNKNKPNLLAALQRRTPQVVLANHLVIKQILLKSGGIGVLPAGLAKDGLQKGTLVQVMPSAKRLSVVLDIAFPRKKTLRYCEQLFIDHLRLTVDSMSK